MVEEALGRLTGCNEAEEVACEVAVGPGLRLRRARVAARRAAPRQRRRQDVAAVVADEVGAGAGLVGHRVEVVEALVEVEQRVGGTLTPQRWDVQPHAAIRDERAPLDETGGPVGSERRVDVGRTRGGDAADSAVWPLARGCAVHVGLLDVAGGVVHGDALEQREPRRPRDVLRAQGLGQVVPGDLGSERVEPGVARLEGLGQRRDGLVAAAVAATDREDGRVLEAERVVGGRIDVTEHPVQVLDDIEQSLDVLCLQFGVLHVREVTRLSEPALVEREPSEPGVEPVVHVRGPGTAPAVAGEDQGNRVRRVRASRAEQRVVDLGPVVRGQDEVLLHVLPWCRVVGRRTEVGTAEVGAEGGGSERDGAQRRHEATVHVWSPARTLSRRDSTSQPSIPATRW